MELSSVAEHETLYAALCLRWSESERVGQKRRGGTLEGLEEARLPGGGLVRCDGIPSAANVSQECACL